MTRKQCKNCPWKKGSKPRKIPGYCQSKHVALRNTIASHPRIGGTLRVMACHESLEGAEEPCVGWLVNQLGPGNNLLLRLQVMRGTIDADVELDGPQFETFGDTVPVRKPIDDDVELARLDEIAAELDL